MVSVTEDLRWTVRNFVEENKVVEHFVELFPDIKSFLVFANWLG